MIFRQETIQKQAKKIRKKKKRENNRKRNHILNFRVSDEEYELINKKIELSQMSKQDYFIKLLIEHEISVRADYRVADAISKEIFQLARVIKKVGKLNEIEDETERENIYKPMFSAYSSKNVKFHVAKEERVEDLLQGDFFEILKGEEKKKYFENKFVTFETTVEENEDLVISGLGWINVKRGPLTIELTVPEGVKVIVRPSIFKGKK